MYIGNTMDATNATWRPPYPSENLKTPKTKTYSTTNPYAMPEEQQSQPSHPSHQANMQESQHSKRENNSNKIYERGLTPQVGMNPFLQGNYLQDLETQNQFLKPINSNSTSKASDVIPKNV
jgi:hypothetical protein